MNARIIQHPDTAAELLARDAAMRAIQNALHALRRRADGQRHRGNYMLAGLLDRAADAIGDLSTDLRDEAESLCLHTGLPIGSQDGAS